MAAPTQISGVASAAWMAPGLDGMSGIRLSGGLDAAPQWRQTLARQGRASPAVWSGALDALAGEPQPAQIKAVNFIVNRVPYRGDREAWGQPDDWAIPEEFFARGDCEDYAIAKYFALRALGSPASRLYILMLRDELKREGHAVLLVDGPGGALLLDNRNDRIVPWRERRHFRPIFWVNETSGWLPVAR